MNTQSERQTFWDVESRGPLTLDAVRELHVPNGDFLISPYKYPAATRFSGAARAGIVYVLNGSCRYDIDGRTWQLIAPCFAELPEGRYNFEAGNQTGVELVHVWELPVGFRQNDLVNEQ